MNFIITLFTSISFYEFLLSIFAIIIGIYSTNYLIKHADLERCIADLSDAKFLINKKSFFDIVIKPFNNPYFEYHDIIYMEQYIDKCNKELNFYINDVNVHYKFFESRIYSKDLIDKYIHPIKNDLNKLLDFHRALVDTRNVLCNNSMKNNRNYVKNILNCELHNKSKYKQNRRYTINEIKSCIYKLNKDLDNYKLEFEYIHSKTIVGKCERVFNHFDLISTALILIIIIILIVYELYVKI